MLFVIDSSISLIIGRRPGGPIPPNPRVDGSNRPPGAPRIDFRDFWATPERPQKTSIFRHRPKSPKVEEQSTPGRPGTDFGPKNMTFGVPFWLHFSTFSKNRKTMKSMTLTTFWKVFHLQKPLIFRWIFHQFSCFFQNPSRRPFLEGPGADLYSKVRFWDPSRISGGLEIGPWTPHFRRKSRKSGVLRSRGDVPGPPGARSPIPNGTGTNFYRFRIDF